MYLSPLSFIRNWTSRSARFFCYGGCHHNKPSESRSANQIRNHRGLVRTKHSHGLFDIDNGIYSSMADLYQVQLSSLKVAQMRLFWLFLIQNTGLKIGHNFTNVGKARDSWGNVHTCIGKDFKKLHISQVLSNRFWWHKVFHQNRFDKTWEMCNFLPRTFENPSQNRCARSPKITCLIHPVY